MWEIKIHYKLVIFYERLGVHTRDTLCDGSLSLDSPIFFYQNKTKGSDSISCTHIYTYTHIHTYERGNGLRIRVNIIIHPLHKCCKRRQREQRGANLLF